MRGLLILCIIFLATSKGNTFFGKYPIQNFTPREYQAGIQNIDFAQNRDMNLFVANNLGVLSFNGSEWVTHNSGTGKKQRSLAFDGVSKRLYVGSQGEFGFFENNWEYVSLRDKIPPSYIDFDEVWDVYLDDSQVYFCTFQGVYQYDGDSINVVKNTIGFDRSFFVNGKLITQDRTGKLFEIRDGELSLFFEQKITNQVVAGIIPYEEGYMLIYNSGQIELVMTFEDVEKHTSLVTALNDTYVNHVLQMSDTRLAISTQTAGLFLYNLQDQRIEKITKEDGLQTNACLRSFQDFAGHLWIGMQNGIAIVDINSPMRLVSQDIGIEGSGYNAFEDESGSYFTTSNGIYFLDKDAKKSTFLTGTEGPAYKIEEMNGKLYAGHHTGLFQLKGGSAKRIVSTNGLWKVQQLRSNPNYAIAGTYSGLYLFEIKENDELKPIGLIDGFKESSRFFEEDQNGRIWVGQYYKGLYQIVLNEELSIEKVNKAEGQFDLPFQEQIVLSRVDNDLYVATNIGLFKLDEANDKFVKAGNFAEEVGEQPVYLFRQDNQKNIHIVAKNTVGFFKQISANNYQFVPSSLYKMRYFLNNDLLHVSESTSRGVYFSGNEGFIHYDPEMESRVISEAPIIVSSLSSIPKGEALYQHNPFEPREEELTSVQIHRGAKVIKIKTDFFDFNSIGNKRFWYRLEGFDDDYSEVFNVTTKEYSNLKEGSYKFTVKTENEFGERITSQPLTLQVEPALHRTLLAKTLYIFFGALLFIGIARLQRQRFKKKEILLEKKKKEELEKKQRVLDQIEAEKEEEVSKLEEEKLEVELRHVNNLLAASTMNLVVKNDFITTIREELKELKLKGENKETKKAMERIVKEIDTTLRIQEDWEQFEYHFDKVHGDFLNRIRSQFNDLTPSEQKLCVFLRLNLNTKEIANLLSISIRGVEVARYRLRKKLNLHKGENLSKFILEF
jgi:hypothetical protein